MLAPSLARCKCPAAKCNAIGQPALGAGRAACPTFGPNANITPSRRPSCVLKHTAPLTRRVIYRGRFVTAAARHPIYLWTSFSVKYPFRDFLPLSQTRNGHLTPHTESVTLAIQATDLSGASAPVGGRRNTCQSSLRPGRRISPRLTSRARNPSSQASTLPTPP